MMIEMDEVQSQLNALIQALDGHDAGSIIGATEALATSVILFRGSKVPRGHENQARLLIENTLRKLETAAIRVNVLKDWTRQRIDMTHAIRGTQSRGASLTY